MGQKALKLVCNVTARDVAALASHYTRRFSLFRLPSLIVSLVVLIMSARIGSRLERPVLGAVLAVTLTLGVLVMIYLLARALAFGLVAVTARLGRNRGLLGTHEYAIDGASLVDRTEVSEMRQNIASFERIASTSKHLIIYNSSVSGLVIPKKRVIEGDVDAFEAELKRLMTETANE